MERKKAGRPSKGDRQLVASRLPTPLVDAMRATAAERGITMNDLLAELAAKEFGIPYATEEGLPLGKSA